MAEDHRTTEALSPVRADAYLDYESTRREAIRDFNTLLMDAKERLRAALKRVQQERVEEAGDVKELAGKLHELIEYLNGAKL